MWARFGPQFPFTITAWLSLLILFPVWFKFKLPGKAEVSDVEG
jgi:hypothetical protein